MENTQSLKRTLFVGGLSADLTKDILQAAFIPFGPIKSVEIPINRESGKHRGFGFVEYLEPEDAEHAVFNMHEAELYGKTLSVKLARAVNRDTLTWENEDIRSHERDQIESMLNLEEPQELFKNI